jgi:hypothetical protein
VGKRTWKNTQKNLFGEGAGDSWKEDTIQWSEREEIGFDLLAYRLL